MEKRQKREKEKETTYGFSRATIFRLYEFSIPRTENVHPVQPHLLSSILWRDGTDVIGRGEGVKLERVSITSHIQILTHQRNDLFTSVENP